MTNLIIAGIVISQIIVTPSSFRWIKEYCVQVLVLSVLCSLIWKYNKWLSAFLGWCFLLFFITHSMMINDSGAQVEYNINFIALLNIINVFLYGFLYYFVRTNFLNQEKIEKAFCFVGVFQSVYVILQKFQLDQFFNNITLILENMANSGTSHATRWPVGTLANEALVGWLICIVSPYFLRFKDLRFKIGYLICFLAILCTKVTAPLMAFVLAYLFWLWNKNKRIAVIATLIVGLLGASLIASGKAEYYLRDTHRLQVWAKSIQLSKKMPITGHGLGSFRVLFYKLAPEFRRDGHWAQAHNEYIQVFFEQGIIGLGIIGGLIWTTLLSFYRKRKGVIPLASILATLIIAFFGFPLRLAMGAILMVSLALYERERDLGYGEKV